MNRGRPMYPNFIVDVLTTTDAERRRRQEAAWRAWARRPDAPRSPTNRRVAAPGGFHELDSA